MVVTTLQVLSALLLVTCGAALFEAKDDLALLGMYAVGLLNGALLLYILRTKRPTKAQQPQVSATTTAAAQSKPSSKPRPTAEITMTVDEFESLRAGRKKESAVPPPSTPSSASGSSRRKSLRTPKEAARYGDWSR